MKPTTVRPMGLNWPRILLAIGWVGLMGLACQNTEPEDRSEHRPKTEKPAPTLVDEPEQEPSRYDSEGVLRAQANSTMDAPIPAVARPTLQDDTIRFLELPASADEVEAFLEKHYPAHEVVRLRNGASFKAIPPGDNGPQVIVNRVGDRYRLSVTHRTPGVEKQTSKEEAQDAASGENETIRPDSPGRTAKGDADGD